MSPSVGMAVIHLFGHPAADFDGEAVIAAVKTAQSQGVQVVSVSMLGHKSDMAFMAVSSDMRELRSFQTALQHAGVLMIVFGNPFKPQKQDEESQTELV